MLPGPHRSRFSIVQCTPSTVRFVARPTQEPFSLSYSAFPPTFCRIPCRRLLLRPCNMCCFLFTCTLACFFYFHSSEKSVRQRPRYEREDMDLQPVSVVVDIAVVCRRSCRPSLPRRPDPSSSIVFRPLPSSFVSVVSAIPHRRRQSLLLFVIVVVVFRLESSACAAFGGDAAAQNPQRCAKSFAGTLRSCSVYCSTILKWVPLDKVKCNSKNATVRQVLVK